MFTQLSNRMQNIFASADKILERKTKELALKLTQDFDNLQRTVKEGEYVIADHKRVVDDREKFLRDKAQSGQRVTRNSEDRRAYWLFFGVMIISSVLAVKAVRFFFLEFYGSVSLLMIIPISIFLAASIVILSIYFNTLADRFREEMPFVFYFLKVASFSIVFLIPIVNVIEGIDSNYRPLVMVVNILLCVVDIVASVALVLMSKVFVSAKDAEVNSRTLRAKDKALAAAEQKLRTFNDIFLKAKNAFSNSAKQFVSSFNELQAINPAGAANALHLLDNFTIWMINNKVFYHEVLRYHVGLHEQPVIDRKFFTSEQDSIRDGFDAFSTVRVDNTNMHQPENEIFNDQEERFTELQTGHETLRRNAQKQTPVENATGVWEPVSEQSQSHPENFDTTIGNVNPNDKIL